MLKHFLAFLALLLLSTPTAWAQNFQLISVDTSQWPQVRLVAALPNGEQKAEYFTLKLSSDGRTIKASELIGPVNNDPTSMVVAVDTSKSLTPNHLAAAKEALSRYVDQLDPEERLALLAFNDKVDLESGFTANRDILKRNLEGLKQGGSTTELYRSLLYGVELLKNLPGRHQLLVVSDGHDEGSEVTREQVLRAAKLNHVRISAVGLPGLPQKDAARYLANLKDIANQTNGTYLEAASADELKDGMYDLLERQRSVARSEREHLYELVFNLSQDAPAQGGSADLVRSTDDGLGFVNFYLQPPASVINEGVSSMTPADQKVRSEFADPGTGETPTAVRPSINSDRAENMVDRSAMMRNDKEVAAPIEADPSMARLASTKPGSTGEPLTERSIWRSPWLWLPLILLLGLAYYLWSRQQNQAALAAKDRNDRSLVLAFPENGKVISVPRGTWLIGSGAKSFIIINDELVAPSHAELTVAGDEWIIRDLDSVNGTQVNGVTIEDRSWLKPGDVLILGQTKAIVR